MPQDDVNERSICRESGVPSHELANPSSIDYDAKDINVGEQRVRQMKWSRITDAMVKLAKQPLTIIDEPGISIGKLRAVARRLVVEKGVRLIGVDYLQLMEGSKESRGRAGSREQEISSISKGLKALAMELNIPVIALAQLNREFEKSEGKRRPRLADLRESGSIGQDADCVIVIHGKDDQIEEAHAEAEISVIANRGGPSGSIDVLFEKPVYRFTDNRHAVAVA
jgi:replicative DNA helicase